MRSNLARRAAAGGAIVLFLSMLSGAPAFGATPEAHETGGASADHRNDASAHDEHSPQAAPHDDADNTEPQPASNADFTGNGANEHGAYDSTRDGSPSANGDGDG